MNATSVWTPGAPDSVHHATLDRSLALQHESELDEEPAASREVVNHDADVIHPLDTVEIRRTRFASRCQAGRDLEVVLISTTARPTRTPSPRKKVPLGA